MGGFQVDVDDNYSSLLCEGRILTPLGVLLMEKLNRLPNMVTDSINDKSKSDNVAKTLAVTQGLWYLVQISARLRAGLPTTLLETNTSVHVIFAVALYGLLWRKPKNVNEPQPIKINH